MESDVLLTVTQLTYWNTDQGGALAVPLFLMMVATKFISLTQMCYVIIIIIIIIINIIIIIIIIIIILIIIKRACLVDEQLILTSH